jgi:hypothetical protein
VVANQSETPLTNIPNDDPAPKAQRNEESKDTLGADQETDGMGFQLKKKTIKMGRTQQQADRI